jgi:ribosomal protein S3AE
MAAIKRKKRFFDVEMPLIKKDTQLLAYELKELEGRYILYDLTRILRGKSIMLQLKVKVNDDKASAFPTQIELLPYYIRRMIRKGTSYIEDSFSVNCKDSQIRIKLFLITRRMVSRKVRNALRVKAVEELKNYVKDLESEKVIEDVLKNQIQRELSAKLKKIYPLALCEIKEVRVEKVLK